MKRFQVSVNGKKYMVEVEELGAEESQAGAGQSMPATAAPVTAPEADTKPAVAAPQNVSVEPTTMAPAAQGIAEGYQVKAPLRGQILRVVVKPGDQVKRGQLLCTIEALKLENEIATPVAGTVTGVFTQPGTNVETGTVLITIREE